MGSSWSSDAEKPPLPFHASIVTKHTSLPAVIANAPSLPSRLDELPLELRSLLVNFMPLPMRAVLALVPPFRVRSDDVMCARSRLCEWAAGEGHLELLKWAHERGFPLLQVKDGRHLCSAAARGGHLAVLKWLREIRCRWDADTISAAAEGGHLEVLQWARERGCPWDVYATIAAARGGHLHVLQWLHGKKCPWSSKVTLEAAHQGHMDVLEWALAKGCPLEEFAAFAGICHSGDERMLQWALREKLAVWTGVGDTPGLTLPVLRRLRALPGLTAMAVRGIRTLATRELARVGDLEGLEWARENVFFDAREVEYGAAIGGQLAVLKWEKENQFGGWGFCSILAQYGHMECLQWALANGERFTAATCAAAARAGRLSVLQWLRENGCAWDGETLAEALVYGHWDVFDWVQKHGCPVDERVCLAAVNGGYAEVLQWALTTAAAGSFARNPDWYAAASPEIFNVLRAHGFEWSDTLCTSYAWRGNLEMLQLAVRNGRRLSAETSRAARNHNNLYLLQWAYENGCPMSAETHQWWCGYDLEKEFAS